MLNHFSIGELTTGYVLACTLLLCLLLRTKWSWRVKAGAITLVSAFYIVIYSAWPLILGWPTQHELPDEFRLIAGYVQAPDRITGDEGSIYLWASDMADRSGQGTPRAYRLPYSPALQTRLAEAGNKLGKNVPQLGKRVADDKHAGKIPLSGRQLGQTSSELEFHDMPAPVMPEK